MGLGQMKVRTLIKNPLSVEQPEQKKEPQKRAKEKNQRGIWTLCRFFWGFRVQIPNIETIIYLFIFFNLTRFLLSQTSSSIPRRYFRINATSKK